MKAKQVIILVALLVLLLASCGGFGNDGDRDTVTAHPLEAGNALAGADVYKASCRNCHGAQLQGVSGLGRPLAPSEFVVTNTENELAAFIAVGRPAGHPENMQGVAMSPKGGNPSLSEQDLLDIAAYLKAQN